MTGFFDKHVEDASATMLVRKGNGNEENWWVCFRTVFPMLCHILEKGVGIRYNENEIFPR